MAVVRESFTSGGTGAAGTSVVVSKPSGTVAGDVLVAVLGFNGNPGTMSPPSGWTLMASAVVQANPRLFQYVKVCDGSEGSTFAFGHTSSVYDGWICSRYSGVDNTTPQDATAVATDGVAATSFTLTGLTTVTDGAMLVVGIAANSSSSDNIVDNNALVSEVAAVFAASTIKNTEMDDGIKTSAGATGTLAYNLGSSLAWAGVVGALRPAALTGGNYLLETGTDDFLLEDSSGVLRIDQQDAAVYDAFTGAAGNLDAHTPDIRPADNMWFGFGAGEAKLDGLNQLVSSGEFIGCYINADISDGTVSVSFGGLSTVIDCRVGLHFRATLVDEWQDHWTAYIYRSADGGYVRVGLEYSAAAGNGTSWEEDAVFNALGPHELKVVLDGTSIKVYLNGTQRGTTTTSSLHLTNTAYGVAFQNGGKNYFDTFRVAPPVVAGALTITVPLLDGASALYAPTITVGPRTLTVPLLDGAPALYAPTITVGPRTLTVPLLDGAPALYAPTVIIDQFVTLGLLDAANALYAPTLVQAAQTVTVPLLDSAPALYAPTVIIDQFVTVPLLDSVPALYAPVVIIDQFLTVPLLDAANAVYAPTVVRAPITFVVPLLDGANALYAPTITQLDPIGQAVWTTPLDTATIGTTPVLTFTMPFSYAPMHFQIDLDDNSGFSSPQTINSDLDQTGWEYWNGSAWTPVPFGGVPQSFSGNEARHTIQSALATGTYYRRVRAGMVG